MNVTLVMSSSDQGGWGGASYSLKRDDPRRSLTQVCSRSGAEWVGHPQEDEQQSERTGCAEAPAKRGQAHWTT